MDKKMYFLISWAINVALLLLLIVMPKSGSAYQILYILTMLMIFVIPLLLTFFQTALQLKSDDKENDIYSIIPNVGSSLIILLTVINFLGSIEKIAIPQMITILFVFVLAELVLGYLKISYKVMSKKQIVWINVATYLSLVVFFVCTMIISIDFGLI